MRQLRQTNEICPVTRIIIHVIFVDTVGIALFALTAMRASAAVHPFPLEQNTDTKKCLECHEEKTKGKSVHSAMGKGCMSCHEIRVNKDVSRVKLITATPSALCLTCHAEKKATENKGTVHPPAVRDCLTCHDPHASENKNELLKPVSGGEKENLCSTCHKVSADSAGPVSTDVLSFPAIANRPGATAEGLAGRIIFPHPAMPGVQLTVKELREVVTYILSLKRAN